MNVNGVDLRQLRDAVTAGYNPSAATVLDLIDRALACDRYHEEESEGIQPVAFKSWRPLILLAVLSFVVQATIGVMIAKALGWV